VLNLVQFFSVIQPIQLMKHMIETSRIVWFRITR